MCQLPGIAASCSHCVLLERFLKGVLRFDLQVTDVETLGCESVWLYFDIGTRDVLQERRLANVGETRDDKCAGVGID